MKVIFLDVDGVMNTDDFTDNIDHSNEQDWRQFWVNRFDPKAMAILNSIVAKTGAAIVLSSTIRLAMNLVDIKMVLGKAGFHGEVAGCTLYLKGASRGAEIKQWVDLYKPSKIAIIDDINDMEGLTEFLVKIDHSTGLTEEYVDRIVALFRS